MQFPVAIEMDEDPIEIHVYDFTGPVRPTGIKPGFFYNIPVEDEEEGEPEILSMRGPYPSYETALDAAKAFVADALASGSGMTVDEDDDQEEAA